MSNPFNEIQELLSQRADYNARLALLPYDGTPEVKELKDGKYLYIKKRVGGRISEGLKGTGKLLGGTYNNIIEEKQR